MLSRSTCARSLLWLVLISLTTAAGDAAAAIELQPVADGLSSPLYLTSAGDGSGRLFIVEQAGRIRIFADGALLDTPFLDISGRVRFGGERGLLGLAFHPSYPANGRFFVNYTRDGPGGPETVVAEFAVSPGDANLALPASEQILLSFRQPFSNHNGGMIAFGPDGFVYIATGDGGSGGDPQGNGQNLETLLGKILRIDIDMDADSGSLFAVPPDNPFVGNAGRDEVWAYGLRNPWRFSFDRMTGRMFAADVGQNSREEVDVIVKGGNYGW
ncbi:MAG: PQQ-dependent sugar dehydrogenase, partial [Acidobacteria bacterium]|nr:PQQ-dependent sugar dehydrogenase [Acidobacteriota bacterium]